VNSSPRVAAFLIKVVRYRRLETPSPDPYKSRRTSNRTDPANTRPWPQAEVNYSQSIKGLQGRGHAPKMAMSAPRPSYSGCAERKRSTPISFFGIIDSRNEGSVRRNPPAWPAVVSSAGGGEDEDEGIAVAATPLLGLGPRVVTAAAPALLMEWSGAEQAGAARRRRRWAWVTMGLCSAAAALAAAPCHVRCRATTGHFTFPGFRSGISVESFAC
jgi:hypothetical protein